MKNHYWTVTPEWMGETAFLLGCGPSLDPQEVLWLKGRRVIAINDAYLVAPWAEILYFCDYTWWEKNRSAVEERFTGRYIVTLENHIDRVRTLRNNGKEGLETDPGAVRNGSNSGYQTINLAYHLGVKRIVLLGYDMQVRGDRLHWRARSDLQTPAGFQRTLRDTMLPCFQTLRHPLAAEGVEVINATPDSALKVWPYRRLWDLLREEVENERAVFASDDGCDSGVDHPKVQRSRAVSLAHR